MKINQSVFLRGQQEFGSVIDITDPCYKKDVWCRINDVHIQAGIYDCYFKTRETTIEFRGGHIQNCTVSAVGIVLDGCMIPTEEQIEYVGEIGVDSGMAGFFENKPDYTSDEWEEFCDFIIKRGGFKQLAWKKPEGFFSVSGDGDGSYAVVGAKNEDGDYYALEIRFFDTIV